jgi:hypothetical protein
LERNEFECNGHDYKLYLALSQSSNSHRNAASETQEQATPVPKRRKKPPSKERKETTG